MQSKEERVVDDFLHTIADAIRGVTTNMERRIKECGTYDLSGRNVSRMVILSLRDAASDIERVC